MDAFTDLFRGVRAQGSVFGSSTLTPPWALRFVDGAPLTMCILLGGAGWIVPEGGEPHRLEAGQTVIVRGPEPFRFVDEVDTPASALDCGEYCATPESGGTMHHRGWNDCGQEATADATTLIIGAYPMSGDVVWRLIDPLPPLLRVTPGGAADAVRAYIAAELSVDQPGQQVVLDRLLDWMLVCSLREWFDRSIDSAPAWYSALHDPTIGPALRVLHDDPAAPWTVASLAKRAGVGRSTFAKRFTDLVGESPLAYLTRWRMTVAADLLVEHHDATIADVARQVGYVDPFAFSTAFKRVKGLSPNAHRRAAAPRRPVVGESKPADPGAAGSFSGRT